MRSHKLIKNVDLLLGEMDIYQQIPLYSLKYLEKIFDSYPERSLNKTTKVTLKNGLLKISSPFNIGFDSYLSDFLGFEY
ncbi:Hypothetical protein CINCED_3A006681 [Cinara cedri]|uniref:Uncharacterized protein n=1 Tax=Cinara cedri TaxID=506608 RepID=A0A5E4M4I6_9HEMI|nr:Hypothetical protein CINCED_3A006681 [Cinara cedri]